MAKRDNSDFMSRRQDEQTEQLEERLTALYANAENEIRSKWADFSAGFEKDDKLKRAMLESGSLPEEEYIAWRKTQILKSTQYSKAVEGMTNVLVKTDEAAMATVNDQLPQVVAESYDYVQALGFKAADEAGLTTGTFQIYNARTVQALIKENPDLMPAPKVNIPEDQRWNKERINREITQGIVQGESIPKIAHRLQQVTTMDRNAAVRNARTAMTGAENLGRYESARDLRENGIPVEEVWMATPDDRTRDSHKLLDGTTRDESGYFGVGIIDIPMRFAGDPLGAPEEVYNCRCRTGIVLQGIDHSQDQDLYEEFMKQFEDGKEMIEGTEPEAESQHQEPEQKTTADITAGNDIDQLLASGEQMTETEYLQWQAENSTEKAIEEKFEEQYGMSIHKAWYDFNDTGMNPNDKWETFSDVAQKAKEDITRVTNTYGSGACGYIQSADGSKAINAYLRRDEVDLYSEKAMNTTIDAMNRLIETTELDRNLIVDRCAGIDSLQRMGIEVGDVGKTGRIGHAFVTEGLDTQQIVDNINENYTGAQIIDKGFMSASVSAENNVFGGSDVTFTILAPEGTHAYISNNTREAEVVFAPSTKQEIIGARVQEREATDYEGKKTKREVIEVFLKIV